MKQKLLFSYESKILLGKYSWIQSPWLERINNNAYTINFIIRNITYKQLYNIF